MHNAAIEALGLDWVYVPFEVAPENVGAAVEAVRALGLVGVNVTVPLKELVGPFLDAIDEDAARIGSVNTICNRGGKLTGYSTDGAGFLRSLEEVGQGTEGRKVYLLGAGGSARAVGFALASRGCFCTIANRTAARAEALAAEINAVYPGQADAAGWGTGTKAFDLAGQYNQCGDDATHRRTAGAAAGRVGCEAFCLRFDLCADADKAAGGGGGGGVQNA